MCEIIRAFVANMKFPLNMEMGNIPADFTDHIKCAGKTGYYQIYYRCKWNLCSYSK